MKKRFFYSNAVWGLIIVIVICIGIYFYLKAGEKEIFSREKESAKISEAISKKKIVLAEQKFLSEKIKKPKPVKVELDSEKVIQVFSAGINAGEPEAKIYLRNLKNARVKNFLKAQLSSPDPEIRFSAAVALARMRDASGKNILLNHLDKGSYLDRLDAACGLYHLGDKIGLVVFETFAQDPDNWYLRLITVKKIGEARVNELRNLAEKLVSDPVIPVRVNAQATICRLDPSECSLLYDYLNSPDTALQYTSAFALAEQGDITALALLQKRFAEGDLSIRGHLGYYLALLGDDSGIPALYEALEYGDPDTKYFAAWALIQLGK